MKRIALITAAIVLAACGGAKEEAPATEEAPAAMVDSSTMAPAADSSMMTPPVDSTVKPDSSSM